MLRNCLPSSPPDSPRAAHGVPRDPTGPASPRCAPDTRKHAHTGQSVAHGGWAGKRSRAFVTEPGVRLVLSMPGVFRWSTPTGVRRRGDDAAAALARGAGRRNFSVASLRTRGGSAVAHRGNMSQSMEEGGAVEPPSSQGARARREGTLRGARGWGWTSRTRCALASPTCAPSCPPFSA